MLETLLNRLRTFALYREGQHADCFAKDGRILLRWRTKPGLPRRQTGFDAEIQGKTFYVLWIEVEESLRGQGHGVALYRLLEQVAVDLGCNVVRMTASGRTIHKEPRADWLARKLGYLIQDGEAIKYV